MKSTCLYFLVILCFIKAAASSAQPLINQTVLLTPIVKQYDKVEWNISLKAVYANPYDQKQVALDMQLISPSGKPLSLPCYYDNQIPTAPQWKARFAPQEAGRYKYHFTLTDHSGTVESPVQTFVSQPSGKPGFLHKNSLYTFKFDNGQLFRGIGENVAWESRSFENPKWTYDYLLPTLSKNGANFFRTWMSPWNLPLEWQISGNAKRYSNTTEYFNPGAIKRMEELLHMADSLHLYIMLTLDMNSGNWRNSPYNQVNGGPVKTWPEFFYSQAAMDKYKNKLRYLVARWGYSTNIAAWEFFNEIDNGVFNKGDSIIIPHVNVTNWHDEMSRYLKDADPYKHLVTTSISHRDIMGLNSIAYIDFNQKHIYKHTEKIPAIYPDYIKTYGKPYVVGEFGYRWEDADPKYAEGADYDFKRGLWFGLFSPTPILPMSWWWEFFDDQHMTPYFRSVRQISDRMLKAGNGSFEQLQVSAGNLHAQAVKCGSQCFVYLLNETDAALTAPLVLHPNSNQAYTLQAFTPSGLQYSSMGIVTAHQQLTTRPVTLGAKQELVLILTPEK